MSLRSNQALDVLSLSRFLRIYHSLIHYYIFLCINIYIYTTYSIFFSGSSCNTFILKSEHNIFPDANRNELHPSAPFGVFPSHARASLSLLWSFPLWCPDGALSAVFCLPTSTFCQINLAIVYGRYRFVLASRARWT